MTPNTKRIFKDNVLPLFSHDHPEIPDKIQEEEEEEEIDENNPNLVL